ncbi:MAG: cytochrome c maturation protein CcmE [Proteobacteria bacterium]|nr:cytochrome c maturation protein CcmE [Pseudomonadota bacterium]MDA1323428.1 cytochrome c maturation protein CcmE [Pseudomonadota bacterium]
MTRKQRRMGVILGGLATLGIAAALVLNAFEDSVVYFHSPTDIATRTDLQKDRRLRLGGLVKQGSWKKASDGLTHKFFVTDTAHDIRVAYKGIMPDLFREGQGVVMEGRLQSDGSFRADEVLAKHDENYMPKEVADSLKEAGMWKGKNKK